MNTTNQLTERNYQQALQVLYAQDDDLDQVRSRFGPPPFWSRAPGFPTLVYIILEQQVSLASAKAAYLRLVEQVDPLTPARFLRLDDSRLRAIGFSRQKASYVRGLAQALQEEVLDLAALENQDDRTAREKLIQLRGIGPWTADIYLLMALRRSDIWPTGDLALVKAIQELKGFKSTPTHDELSEIGEAWRPWRAVATRILWHYYLSKDEK